jgi:hypothetical protein
MPPAKPVSTVSWQGGFFRYREIYPDGLRRWWLGNAGWREPTSSDRLPSIGVSLQPAIPRRVAPQQSPLPLHQSPTIVAQFRSSEAIKCAAHLHCGRSPGRAPSSPPPYRSVISTLRAGCHFYLAPTLTLERAPSICGHELPKLTNSTLLLRIAEQSGLLLLNHRQQPHPSRGDDRERIKSSRQAAEALFTPKRQPAEPSDPAPTRALTGRRVI